MVLKDESHSNADEVLRRIIDKPELFAVPELFALEVFSVLAGLHPDPINAYVEGVIPILQGGILKQPMTDELAAHAYRFIKKGLKGYDACYAALAIELNNVWLTFDEIAHRCLSGEGISHLLFESLPDNWL